VSKEKKTKEGTFIINVWKLPPVTQRLLIENKMPRGSY